MLDGATVAAINATPAQAYFEALVAARRSFYQYRAGHSVVPPALVRFLQSVHLRPDVAMQRTCRPGCSASAPFHSWRRTAAALISSVPFFLLP